MSSQYLSLEEAAKKLGITTEELVAYRSEGRVRGFRDGGSSWKFTETDLERLAEDLADENGSYDPYQMLADEVPPVESPSSGGSGLELDLELDDDSAAGSRLMGSDVNLVAGDDGSDVKVVSVSDEPVQTPSAGGSNDLVELDPDELTLAPEEPIFGDDSGVLELAIDPKTGSTGPIAQRDPDPNSDLAASSDLAFDAVDDDDSGDDVLGLADEDFSAAAGSDLSGLSLADDLASDSHAGADVLSDIDLLGADNDGSGLISGDSDHALGLGSDVLASGPGSSGVGAGSSKGSGLMLDDGDDLLITDDDDALELGGSDLSISGDSGINLMSPSDSGISLESEPLDLAGSSISALDLGAELSSGGSSGKGLGSGSGIGAEDFQLSPSGLSLDADADSSSQVIDVEDSAQLAGDPIDPAAFGDDVEAIDDAFAEPADDDGFGDDAAMDGGGFGDELPGAAAYAAPATPEVPFRPFEVACLACVAVILCVGGMLMSDLVRNMWSYTEPAAPVSGLTDWLLDIWSPK